MQSKWNLKLFSSQVFLLNWVPAAAVGAGGRRPPVHGQLAARRRVERLELGAAREVEGAAVVAGVKAAAAVLGQVLFERKLRRTGTYT